MEHNTQSPGYAEFTIKHQDGQSYTMGYDFGNDVEDAVSRYGADTVFSLFVVGAKTQARNKAYGMAKDTVNKAGEVVSQADPIDNIKEYITQTWTPSPSAERESKDPMAAFLAAFGKMDDAQRAAALQQLREQAS